MNNLSEIFANARRRLSLSPGAVNNEQGRSRNRGQRVALAFFVSLGARLITVMTSFVAVPLMVNHLGEERYGVWLTLNSFLAYLAFADLGLGNGLINAVSEAHALDDKKLARRYISSAFFMLIGLAATVGFVMAFVFPWVPWSAVFATQSELATSEAGPATMVFLLLFLLQVPFTIVQRVNLAYQEGHVNGVFQAAGSLLGLGCVFLSVTLGATLPWIVLSLTGAPLIALAVNWVNLFLRTHRDVSPSPRFVNLITVKRLIRLGGLFFGLQIAVAVAFSSDYIIAAQVLGPEAVTQLGVPSQMFNLVLSILSLFFIPLWPAYAESIVRGDYAWIRIWLFRSFKIALAFVGPVMVVMVLLGENLLRWWIGEEVHASLALLLGLATWTLLATVGNAISMLLNAANVIRFQLVVSIAMAVTAIILKIALALQFGIEGIVWGTVLAYSLVSLGPALWYLRSVLPRRLGQMPYKAVIDESF
jgi:O-antigen/teichoic acid export membrane protein